MPKPNPNKAPLDAAIYAQNELLHVLDGVLNGKTIDQMAKELDVTDKAIGRIKQDVHATLTKHYHDTLEHARGLAAARYELLFNVALDMALGTRALGASEPSGIPDRHWTRLAVEIIDRQVALRTSDEKRAAEKNELNYTNITNITMTSNDEMYTHAQQTMWAKYHDLSPAEMEAILGGRKADIVLPAEPSLADIQANLNTIMRELPQSEADAD